jgi:hypothetical protein
VLLKILAHLALLGAAAALQAPRVQILSDQPLPPALNRALDIRWAGDDSVYLARGREGTVQASVNSLGGQIRDVIPGVAKTGGFWASHRLAGSARYLVVAAPFGALTWQPVTGGPRKELGLDVMDMDLHQDRLVVLGARRDNQGRWAPDGAIAWLGSLDQGLRDLKPVLFDSRGAGAPNLAACGFFELGAVRFLEDGSFLVLPGVQPGAFLYGPTGKLLRTWDTGTLDIDTDCSDLSVEQARQLQEPGARVVWLNQRRTVDDIFPLPEGPALLVKSVSGGQTRWEMQVLQRQGGVSTYPLPITYSGFHGVLHADIRGDRVAFLLVDFKKNGLQSNARLILGRLNTNR